MKDKEKQIEEMANDIKVIINTYYLRNKNCDEDRYIRDIAKILLEKYQSKLPKNSVVLSREEINNADYFYVKDGELIPVEKGRGKFITTEWYKELLMKMPLGHELARERKETAEKIYYKAEKKAHFKDGGYYDKDRYYLDMEDLKEILKQFGVEIKE